MEEHGHYKKNRRVNQYQYLRTHIQIELYFLHQNQKIILISVFKSFEIAIVWSNTFKMAGLEPNCFILL